MGVKIEAWKMEEGRVLAVQATDDETQDVFVFPLKKPCVPGQFGEVKRAAEGFLLGIRTLDIDMPTGFRHEGKSVEPLRAIVKQARQALKGPADELSLPDAAMQFLQPYARHDLTRFTKADVERVLESIEGDGWYSEAQIQTKCGITPRRVHMALAYLTWQKRVVRVVEGPRKVRFKRAYKVSEGPLIVEKATNGPMAGREEMAALFRSLD